MKKVLAFVLMLALLCSAFVIAPVTASAESVNDMFFNLAFGVTQSGHVEAGANNYYKFTLSSYTTLTIDYDSVDQYGDRYSGKLFVIKANDYDKLRLGEACKTYFSTQVKMLNNKNTKYDGNMSLYAGTYYLIIDPSHRWSDETNGYGDYTVSVTPTVTKLKKISAGSSTSAVTLSWTGDLGATGYQVQRKTGSGYKTVAKTDDMFFTEKKLSSGSTYTYRVRGYASVGGNNYYGPWRSITAVTKPGTPTLKSVSTNTKHKITSKWTKVTPSTGYQVQYSLKKNFSSAATKTVNGSANVKNTVTGKKGKVYYVRVRAFRTVDDKRYYSAWSKTKKIKCK